MRTPFRHLFILIFGYTFLYLPILLTILYSFNSSRLMSMWGGFSFKLYEKIFTNTELISAAFLSLKIAATSATCAVFFGTMAAVALSRLKTFRGFTLFSTLLTAPLVMPDIITGLALLLTFISFESLFGWPSGRGFETILISHVTFSIAYVAIIVKARLEQFDLSLEEAAMDLGCRPLKAFLVITIPIITPALLAGWLLAFTLSLDDVVIASFVSGPGTTTLPMVVFSSVRLGISPEINALGAVIISCFAIVLTVSYFVMHRKKD
jgi:putrescine transport system permease protein